MADDKVALEIFIEADKAEMTLGDLEAGFDSMKERLKEVGRGSEEFKTLSTAMAQTTGEIKNIELGFEGLGKEENSKFKWNDNWWENTFNNAM